MLLKPGIVVFVLLNLTKSILSNKVVESSYIENTFITIKKPILVHQPFGSQSYPDFVIVNSKFVIPIEAKFSKNGIPTWNSNLPKSFGLYIFASKPEKRNLEVTFFMGDKLLTQLEKERIVDLVEKFRNDLDQEGQMITSKFQIYLRPMFNQKLNLTTNEYQSTWESEAIELFSKIDIS